MPGRRLAGDVALNPGGLFVGAAPQRVRTLLGSCVSVTLWHPQLRVGAMSHFLLAERGTARPGASEALDGRYGDEAMRWMVAALGRRGAQVHQCEAKVFGGGNMFPGQRTAGPAPDVGRRNGEAARRLLAGLGVHVLSEDLFGNGHRQVLFDLSTGAVWCRLKTSLREAS